MTDYKQSSKQLRAEGKVVSDRPFDDCRSCPMYPNCPLIRFMSPCVFRAIALWQKAHAEQAARP